MIQALIVDDEKHCRESLKAALQRVAPNVEIMQECASVSEGLEAVRKFHPELVFLDVQMGNETGFDFLQHAEVNFEVIFTTAFESYALKAIKFCALDYLLKPVSEEDLKEAINRFESRRMDIQRFEDKKGKSPPQAEQIEELMHNFKVLQSGAKKIALPTHSGLSFIPMQDIVRCEADTNYTIFHLIDKSRIMVARHIKEYEEMLEEYNFMRIHNSHLINMAHIKNYTRGEGGTVKMDDGSEIDVSRRRKEEFLKKLSKQKS